jgi:hypothetical protein
VGSHPALTTIDASKKAGTQAILVSELPFVSHLAGNAGFEDCHTGLISATRLMGAAVEPEPTANFLFLFNRLTFALALRSGEQRNRLQAVIGPDRSDQCD